MEAEILPQPHCMTDIETLGTKPGSIILSIGAVAFGRHGLAAEFYTPILETSCRHHGLTADESTLNWWAQQSQEARDAAFNDPAAVALDYALQRFHEWYTDQQFKRVWCHGATFDVPLLEAAYRAIGQTPPWAYNEARCTRTLYDLAGISPDRSKGVHHNALNDAKVQADAAVAAINKLGGKLWA